MTMSNIPEPVENKILENPLKEQQTRWSTLNSFNFLTYRLAGNAICTYKLIPDRYFPVSITTRLSDRILQLSLVARVYIGAVSTKCHEGISDFKRKYILLRQLKLFALYDHHVLIRTWRVELITIDSLIHKIPSTCVSVHDHLYIYVLLSETLLSTYIHGR